MKKTLLTLSAVLSISAVAFGQGSLILDNRSQPDLAGFNTVTSNDNDATLADYVSGTVTLELFTLATGGSAASEVATINTDAASAGSEQTAVSLLTTDGFTQQGFGTTLANETLQNNFAISEGDFTGTSAGTYQVGSSSTLTSGTTVDVYYAVVALYSGKEGVLVLSPTVTGGGSNPPANMNSAWPNQNLLLAPVPEPTTLALAGLGGLSMLFLRRRKA